MQTQTAGIYRKTTYDVEVLVEPNFVEEQSDLEENVYVYSYTVTLKNHGTKKVQLVNRHWKVFSAGKQIADVKGEGVIGEQPVLEAGGEYEYTSWTTVVDDFGSMVGTYTFYSESGEFFDVEVPEFLLLYVDESSVH